MENFGDTLLNLAEEVAFSERKVYMFAAQLTLRLFSPTADGLIMLIMLGFHTPHDLHKRFNDAWGQSCRSSCMHPGRVP
eukprot:820308-Prymnesium_polylepis.1